MRRVDELLHRVTEMDIVLRHGSALEMAPDEANIILDRVKDQPEIDDFTTMLDHHVAVIDSDAAGACYLLVKIVGPRG